MINRFTCTCITALALAILMPSASPASADDAADGIAVGKADAATAAPEEVLSEAKVKTRNVASAFAGYRFLQIDSFGGRAAEYEYLHSSAVGGALFDSLGKDLKFSLEGAFLNDKDYHGDLLTDYKGLYRFHLRTESLFHNLDHEQLFTPAFTSQGIQNQSNDLNPADRYGIRVEQDLAQFRYRLRDYPVHLNLGYWRLAKEGNSQLRFADHAFQSPTGGANTIFSRTRRIDRQTHEASIGLDSHLGPVDLIYDFKIREFDDRVATPRDNFVERRNFSNALVRSGGLQEHNEDPESRFHSHTVKLHTSLTGGIVGAASYTFGRRESLSNLEDVIVAERSRDTLHNAAGDFVYTPCKEFSLALKYRRQEVDRDNPATISSAFSATTEQTVRASIDTVKDVALATVSFRPTNLLSFKGEYKGEFQQRENAELWQDLAASSDTHRGTFSILSRPLKGLRIKALYSYSTTNRPDYGNSFAEKHEGQFLATYNSLNRWGFTANCRIAEESNDQIGITVFLPPAFQAESLELARGREKSSTSTFASVWVTPLDRLTITGSYGLLRNKTDQALLFDSSSSDQAVTNYAAQAQVYSISSVYRLDERLDLSLALQQVRSFSEMEPESKTVGGVDTSGIKEISRARTVESSVSARADYHLTRNISCALDYSYRDYDEKNSASSDGTVQTVMARLAAKW